MSDFVGTAVSVLSSTSSPPYFFLLLQLRISASHDCRLCSFQNVKGRGDWQVPRPGVLHSKRRGCNWTFDLSSYQSNVKYTVTNIASPIVWISSYYIGFSFFFLLYFRIFHKYRNDRSILIINEEITKCKRYNEPLLVIILASM